MRPEAYEPIAQRMHCRLLSTESAPQFDSVKYKNTKENWQSAAEPWYRWASLAEEVVPSRIWHAGRLRKPRVGLEFFGWAVEAQAGTS
jgi:hypothetical protein